MTDPPDDGGGFVAFYRRYTKTWVHALATAALTTFGTLTFVDRLFAVLAVAAYVLPPVVLYFMGSSPRPIGGIASDEGSATDRDRRPSPTENRPTETADDGSATADDRSKTTGDRPAVEDDRSGVANEASRTWDDGSETGDDGSKTEADRSETGGTGPDPETSEPGPGPETDEPGPGWRTADVPTGEALRDVVVTDAGAYAVGADGTVLADEGDGWSTVVPDGPGARSNPLDGVDATEGGSVWFAGDGGAVGRLDPSTGRHVDHSAPDGDTTNVDGVAAADDGGAETVLLVDGSGRVRRGRYRDGEVAWDEPATPGSGSSVAGVALLDGSVGFVCDTSGSVFEVRDGGRTFRRIDPDSADGTFTDVAATGPGTCAVSTDDGVVLRYDGTTWTPVRPGDGPLWALAVRDGRWIAVGDGGVAYERAGDCGDWERVATPATAPLRGVSLGASRAVAVGDEGTVVERALRRSRNDRR